MEPIQYYLALAWHDLFLVLIVGELEGVAPEAEGDGEEARGGEEGEGEDFLCTG